MTYKKYSTSNNAVCTLSLAITDLSTLIVGAGTYDRFPASNFIIKLSQYSGTAVIARENIYITTRTGANFVVGTRAYEAVPIDDTVTTATSTALPFAIGSTIELVTSEELIADMQTEITRLEDDKLDEAGGAMTGAILQAKGADIASASTVNLALATGNEVHITGTTPITSFGTVQAGAEFTLIFDGVTVLTHNATSLILPYNGANITTAVGDVAKMTSEGGGNWRCSSYIKADGTPLSASFVAVDSLLDSTYANGEAVTAGQAVFPENVTSFSSAIGLAITGTSPTGSSGTTGAVTSKDGIKIILTTPTTISTVTRHAAATCSTCYITNSVLTTIYSASFVGGVATFTNATLPAGTYYILADSGGASYTMQQHSGTMTPAFPISFTSGNITAGYVSGDNTALLRNISSFTGKTEALIGDSAANTRVSFPVFGTGVAATTMKLAIKKISAPSATFSYRIETDNAGSPSGTIVTNGSGTLAAASITTSLVDTTLTLAGSVTLTAGARYHLVLFAGTYGSETVNSTNYYAVGYAYIDTTTRPTKTWSGSAWSSAVSTTFCYVFSSLFKSIVLSLTDSDFSYKSVLYGISSETKAVGLFPKITIGGVNSNQSGLTINSTYYLGNTPGTINTTAGSNGTSIGSAISATQLLLSTGDNGFSSGTTSRSAGTGAGVQVIAHGLGSIPRKIKMTAFAASASNGNVACESTGVYNGVTTNCISRINNNGGSSSGVAISSNIIDCSIPAVAQAVSATMTFDSTNITLSWIGTVGTNVTIAVLWEAYA